MRFTESGPPLTEERLQAAEHRLRMTLPAEYGAFLLRHNGGRPHPNRFRFTSGEKTRSADLHQLFSVLDEGDNGLEQLAKDWRKAHGRPPAHLLPIGDAGDDNLLCLSTRAEDAGAVFYCRVEPEGRWDEVRPNGVVGARDVVPVADTFDAFLAGLYYRKALQPWTPLIDAGDVSGLTAWLDGGGSPDVSDPEHDLSALEHAARMGEVEIVRLLLDRGAATGAALLYALQAKQTDTAKALLRSGRLRRKDVEKAFTNALWDDPELLALFVEQGVDLNAPESGAGLTPLHLAAWAGSAPGIQWLLEHGAAPAPVSPRGETPLHFALLSGSVEAVKACLDAGESLDARHEYVDDPVAEARELVDAMPWYAAAFFRLLWGNKARPQRKLSPPAGSCSSNGRRRSAGRSIHSRPDPSLGLCAKGAGAIGRASEPLLRYPSRIIQASGCRGVPPAGETNRGQPLLHRAVRL